MICARCVYANVIYTYVYVLDNVHTHMYVYLFLHTCTYGVHMCVVWVCMARVGKWQVSSYQGFCIPSARSPITFCVVPLGSVRL